MNMKTIRRSAPEIIAFHLGWDINDVKDTQYCPTQLAAPRVYSIDLRHDGIEYAYLAAPSNNKMKPNYANLEWVKIGEEYGRFIFGATGQ
jgi:hypothetical protein